MFSDINIKWNINYYLISREVALTWRIIIIKSSIHPRLHDAVAAPPRDVLEINSNYLHGMKDEKQFYSPSSRKTITPPLAHSLRRSVYDG